MNFKFFLMGSDWSAAFYSMNATFFRFVLNEIPGLADYLSDFEDDIQTDGENVVIPGSVMAGIEEEFPGFEDGYGKDFDVYDQTKSGTGHGLTPFEF